MKKLITAMMSLLVFGGLATAAAATLYSLAGIPPYVTVAAAMLTMLCRAYHEMRRFDRGISNDRYKQFTTRAAPQVEIWARFIMGVVFKNNYFLKFCFSVDDYVLQGKVVHIPQAGAASNVQKNRSALPATVVKRTDTDVTYPLDEFTTDPRLIPNADTVELSYNKMESVTSDDMDALRQTVADNIIIAWAPTVAENLLPTSGALVESHLADTTGYRKMLTPSDLKQAQKHFNKRNVPSEGRYVLISADMHDQLISALTEGQYRDFSSALDPSTGVVGKLYGFNIIMRSSVLTYTSGGDIVAYGADALPDDCDAALCWQINAVERAMGEIKVFDQSNSPQYYGDLMSFLMRMGGRIRRADENGVCAIVQYYSATNGN